MNREGVLQFVADFKGMNVRQITDQTRLQLNSLEFERFAAGLENKFSITLQTSEMKEVKTVGDLWSFLHLKNSVTSNTSSKHDFIASTEASASSYEVSTGIDLEETAQFRKDIDVEEDTFFLRLFTRAEMAYCLLQDDPAPHFTARFCAKEALKKASSLFLDVPYTMIEVAHKQDGSPFLRYATKTEITGVSLSLTHTSSFAAASVIYTQTNQKTHTRNERQESFSVKDENRERDWSVSLSHNIVPTRAASKNSNKLTQIILLTALAEGAGLIILLT